MCAHQEAHQSKLYRNFLCVSHFKFHWFWQSRRFSSSFSSFHLIFYISPLLLLRHFGTNRKYATIRAHKIHTEVFDRCSLHAQLPYFHLLDSSIRTYNGMLQYTKISILYIYILVGRHKHVLACLAVLHG